MTMSQLDFPQTFGGKPQKSTAYLGWNQVALWIATVGIRIQILYSLNEIWTSS